MTDKRKAVSLPEDLLKEINAYRRQQDPIPSESEAIRQLLQIGINAWRQRAAKKRSAGSE